MTELSADKQGAGLGLADAAAENALLVGLIEAISSGPDVEQLANRVAPLIVAATATDECFVHVLDDTERSLTLVGATPPFDAEVGRISLRLGEGVTGWAASHRQPVVIVDHKDADPRYRYFPELRGEDYTSMASVPMASAPGGLVGVLNVHTRARREFSERDIRLLTSIGSLLAGAVHQARLHRRLAARERAHERFTEQAIAAQEAERRRLAADIHDGITQRLCSLRFHLDAASDALMDDPDFATEQLVWARTLAHLTLDEARAAINGLRPPVLDDLGLADGLASLARSTPDVEVIVDVDDSDECALPEHVEIALYRIAQEALQNVVKHADASTVRLRLRREGPDVVLEVRDDGRGFDPRVTGPGTAKAGATGDRAAGDSASAGRDSASAGRDEVGAGRDGVAAADEAGAGRDEVAAAAVARAAADEARAAADEARAGRSSDPIPSSGYGMDSMAERAELIGGRLDVSSRPGRGTTVTARVSLSP